MRSARERGVMMVALVWLTSDKTALPSTELPVLRICPDHQKTPR